MADHRFVRGDLVVVKHQVGAARHQGAGEVRGYVNGEVLVKYAGPEGSYSQRWPENKLAFYSAPKKMATKRAGQTRTRPVVYRYVGLETMKARAREAARQYGGQWVVRRTMAGHLALFNEPGAKKGDGVLYVTAPSAGSARTRPSSRTARWAEVRAAEKAGHPMKHPRRYVFGE